MAYCNRCARWFPHDRALEQHKDNSSFHNFCYDCGLDFASYDERIKHYTQSPKHYYCIACHELFDSYSGLEKHDHEVHNHCTACRRNFQNQNNLQQHLNSKLHRPSTIPCPGRGCDRLFISVAALALHFESGTCPSGMTREQLNRLAVRADRNNVITNPSRLIGGPLGYEAPSNTKLWATIRSWNGTAFECFLCHSTFNTLDRLNQHMKSPVHDQKIYRCPKLDCRIDFNTLSALCQHVEGGYCGVRMFRQVRDTMDSLTRGFKAIGI